MKGDRFAPIECMSQRVSKSWLNQWFPFGYLPNEYCLGGDFWRVLDLLFHFSMWMSSRGPWHSVCSHISSFVTWSITSVTSVLRISRPLVLSLFTWLTRQFSNSLFLSFSLSFSLFLSLSLFLSRSLSFYLLNVTSWFNFITHFKSPLSSSLLLILPPSELMARYYVYLMFLLAPSSQVEMTFKWSFSIFLQTQMIFE